MKVLYQEGLKLIPQLTKQPISDLFPSNSDNIIDKFVRDLSTNSIVWIGTENFPLYWFSKIVDNKLLKYLIVTRLTNLGNKLKVIVYLKRYRNIDMDIMKIYRFINHTNSKIII